MALQNQSFQLLHQVMDGLDFGMGQLKATEVCLGGC